MGQRLCEIARQIPVVLVKAWAISPRTVGTTGNEDAIKAAAEVTPYLARIGTNPTISPRGAAA
jgi:hypothetical protein